MQFPAPPHDPYEAVAELAGGTLATIRLTQGLVCADRAVDLAGLDGVVGLVCARALDLPPEQGRRLRPELLRLAAAMEVLEAALRSRSPGEAEAP